LPLVELRLASYEGLADALASNGAGPLAGRTLARAEVSTPEHARELRAIDGSFEVCVDLTRDTARWLETLAHLPSRLALRQPTYERLTESAQNDDDWKPLFERIPRDLPVEGVPACMLGRAPRPARRVLDTAMRSVDGRLEIFRYTRRFILEGYRTKSLRCAECREDSGCRGMHINYVRAHGYAPLRPLAVTGR
jgi:hypothetical protein